jgi:hypothetical protein
MAAAAIHGRRRHRRANAIEAVDERQSRMAAGLRSPRRGGAFRNLRRRRCSRESTRPRQSVDNRKGHADSDPPVTQADVRAGHRCPIHAVLNLAPSESSLFPVMVEGLRRHNVGFRETTNCGGMALMGANRPKPNARSWPNAEWQVPDERGAIATFVVYRRIVGVDPTRTYARYPIRSGDIGVQKGNSPPRRVQY